MSYFKDQYKYVQDRDKRSKEVFNNIDKLNVSDQEKKERKKKVYLIFKRTSLKKYHSLNKILKGKIS